MIYLLLAVFFFPLALYSLILGLINRRRNPLVVSGTWDFVGVLFAASGFLIFGGPAILAGFYDKWRQYLLGRPQPMPGVMEVSSYFGVTVMILYFLVVILGAAFMLLLRRHSTVIYNVDPKTFDEVSSQVLDSLGYSWERSGNILRIRVPDSASNKSDYREQAIQASPVALHSVPARLRQQMIVLQVEASSAMSHVLLRWDSPDRSPRQEIERELARALAVVYTRDNPLSGWFLIAGTVLFCFSFLLLLVVLIQMLPVS